MKLGKTIKEVRRSRGLTQEELAEKTSVTRPYISMLERDSRDPSWSFLCSLCSALDIPVAFLIVHASAEDEAMHEDARAISRAVVSMTLGKK